MIRFALAVLTLGCGDTSPDTDTNTTPAGSVPTNPETTPPPPGTVADGDRDGVADSNDCAPDDPNVFPGAAEQCDLLDNDCDGLTDEDFDFDLDGYLVDTPACRALGSEVDCNDGFGDIHPNAEETCDDRDENCNAIVDDTDDDDDDGFDLCSDCDDDDEFIFPGAAEACDGIDNDCTGGADEVFDEDGDGAAGCWDDCDDRDPGNAPNLPEICDGHDNNCDGVVDDGFDLDGDGWLTCLGDCNDGDATINPAVVEVCDAVDTDCDGVILDDLDLDGDGWTLCEGDCNDNKFQIFPTATDICDGFDNDCDLLVDEDPSCYGCTDVGDWLACTDAEPWGVALSICESFGQSLVTVDDAVENAAMVAAVDPVIGPTTTWIGLSDATVEGVFEWADGTPFSYTNWGVGEPASADCAYITFSNQLWRTADCTLARTFVCE